MRRAEAFVVLAADREVEGFELRLAARTLAAGWGGDLAGLLEATAAVMALRARADGTDPARLAGRYPQLGYLVAVERALAGRGVGVLCREVGTGALDLHGRLVLDLARAVGAHPATHGVAVAWDTARGWSTVIEPPGGVLPSGGQRVWHWFDGLLPEPDAVAARVVRHLDGDLDLPARRAWRCDGPRLLAALERHPLPADAPRVPTVCRPDPDWRPVAFRRRLLRYDPPPVPAVGAEVHLPGSPGDRRRVAAVLPVRAGEPDLFRVRLAGHDFEVSWDELWPYLSAG